MSCRAQVARVQSSHITTVLYRGHYVGIHASGFRDFLLKPELLRAVVDCGFEHPSEGAASCFIVATKHVRRPDGIMALCSVPNVAPWDWEG